MAAAMTPLEACQAELAESQLWLTCPWDYSTIGKMTSNEIREVINTYEAMIARAKQAGKRLGTDQRKWATDATIALMVITDKAVG